MSDEVHKPLQFFISRAGNQRDIQWAKWVQRALTRHGYTCFLQDDDIRTGHNFQMEMEAGLERADHLIAILSHDFVRSRYAMAELRAVFFRDVEGSQRRVIVVRVDQGCTLPVLYSGLVYLDLDEPDEKAERDLLTRILEPVESTRLAFQDQKASRLPKDAVLAERVRGQFIDSYLDPILREAKIKIEPPLATYAQSALKPFSRVDLYQFIHDIKNGSRLLVAGTAGSGKTILLLQCLKSLLPVSPTSDSQTPILLNVSTWVDPTKPAGEQRKFRDWVKRQLLSQYGVVPAITEQLIGDNRLIYCLDDFHQIMAVSEPEDFKTQAYRRELRAKFLEELAEFLGRHRSGNSAGLIMTARTEQSDDLKCIADIPDLDFQRIFVLPMDSAEIMESVKDTNFHQIFSLAAQHASVRTLLENPSHLQMLAAVIAGTTSEAAREALNYKAEKGQLIEEVYRSFVNKRVARFVEYQEKVAEGRATRVTGEQVRTYLGNLARYLMNRGRLTLRVDELQPRDLPEKARLEYSGIVALVFALAVAVTGGTPAGIADAFEWTMLRHSVLLGIRYGLLTHGAVTIFGGGVIALGYRYLRRFPLGLAVGLAFGIVRGFVIGLSAEVPSSATTGAAAGLRQGVLTAAILMPVFGWVLYRVNDNPLTIEPIEIYEPDRGRTKAAIGAALAVGVCFWYFLGAARGISFGGLVGIVLVTFFARRPSRAPIEIRPNQAIRSSAEHAIFFALRFTLSASLLFGIVYGYYYGLEVGINNALLGLGGFILFFFFGGMPVLKHIALRLTLCLRKLAPWRLETFLINAARAGLVTQVGAGFTFQSDRIRNFLADYAPIAGEWGMTTVASPVFPARTSTR
jgi:hypothetical protein